MVPVDDAVVELEMMLDEEVEVEEDEDVDDDDDLSIARMLKPLENPLELIDELLALVLSSNFSHVNW